MKLNHLYNSIGFRISFSIAALIAAATIIVSILIYQEEKNILELELQKRGGYLARVMRHNVIEPLLYEERFEIYSTLNSSMIDDESLVVYSEVYNEDRELVVRSFKDTNWQNLELPPFYFDDLTNVRTIREDSELQLYHISLTIDVEPVGPVGFLRLGITKKFLLMTLREVRVKLLLFSVVVIFLGALLGVWTSKKIINPIHILNNGVKRIGAGEVGVEIPVVGDGEIRELALSFNKMSGKLKELINDITAAQENLIRTEKLYAIGEFSAGVAHEIKNPLTSIKLLMQTLAHKKQAISSQDFAIIEGEINRIDKIVKEFLAFARPEKVEKKDVNINDALQEVITITWPKMKQSRIELVQMMSSDLPVIMGNSDGLKQVFLNIVLNAIQAMHDGGTLIIKTRANEKQLLVDIKDSGFGIPEKHLKDIFNPFFTTKEDGTGMGLAIAYTIISDHSGKLIIESKTGIGTTVQVELPL